MHGRVDPTSSLRQEHLEGVRHFGTTSRLWAEDHLAVRERAQQQGRQESILSKEKQVLLMQRCNRVLAVLARHLGLDDDRDPIIVV